MQKAQQRRKPRYGRIVFLLACMVFMVFGLVNIVAKPDPYKVFKDVSDEMKHAGTPAEVFEETEDGKAKFIHYPEFENTQINERIAEVIEAFPDEDGITFVDYESYITLDAYTTVIFHYQLMDSQKQLQKEAHYSYSFVTESGKQMELNDVLRRDYTSMIKTQFLQQADVTLSSLDEVSLMIGDQALTLYAGQKQISLSYDEFKNYIKIPGKSIAEEQLEMKRNVPVDPEKPMIALTFDDGPSPITQKFMNVFEQHQATASFFMLGKNVVNYPDTVKHMYENGFELCNHSWDHQNLSGDDAAFITQEVFDTQDAIFRLTGHEPTRIRPPYGAYNELTTKVADGNGVKVTLWNVDTEDWRSRDAEAVLQCAKDGARDGAIILFHDLYPSTLGAIESLVPYLQEAGYQLVTISDLFKYKGDFTGL